MSHGRILAPSGLSGPFAVMDTDGSTVLGVYEDDGTKAKPVVVLAPGTPRRHGRVV